MAEEDLPERGVPSGDADWEGVGVPMKKASPLTWAALVAGAVIVGGLVIYASGGETGGPPQQTAASELPTASEPRLTAKEAEAHLLKTQKAFTALEAEADAAGGQAAPKQAALQDEAGPKEQAEPGPRPAGGEQPGPVAASQPAKTPHVKTQPAKAQPAKAPAAKQTLDSLDSLGSDITSALE